MDFRAGVALPGHFGVELDVRKLDDQDGERLSHWIATYKAHRDQLHTGKLWQGGAGDGLLWQAHGEAEDLLLFLYRIAPQSWRHAPPVRLAMLEPARRYSVDGVEYDGAWLVANGLPTQAMKAERFQLIEVKTL